MMLEAFERHLKEHNISKKFEEAKSKEDKIEVCKKYLEGEGFFVKGNLSPQKQYDEYKTKGMAPSINTLNSIVWDSSRGPVPTISDMSVTTTQAVKYLTAKLRLSDAEMSLGFNDKLQMESYVLDDLTRQIAEGIRQHMIDKNLLKSETDVVNLDKIYAVRIGIVG